MWQQRTVAKFFKCLIVFFNDNVEDFATATDVAHRMPNVVVDVADDFAVASLDFCNIVRC